MPVHFESIELVAGVFMFEQQGIGGLLWNIFQIMRLSGAFGSILSDFIGLCYCIQIIGVYSCRYGRYHVVFALLNDVSPI